MGIGKALFAELGKVALEKVALLIVLLLWVNRLLFSLDRNADVLIGPYSRWVSVHGKATLGNSLGTCSGTSHPSCSTKKFCRLSAWTAGWACG